MGFFIAIFAGIFIYIIFKGATQYIDNENSPLVTEPAHVVRKINDTHMDANNVMHTTVLIVFALESGEQIRCVVGHRVYRAIPDGASGMLTHQGTRFYRFESGGIVVEK
jgi:hypothetical protein